MEECVKKEGECPAIPTPRPLPQRQPGPPQRHTGAGREQPPPGRPNPPHRPRPAGSPRGPQSQRAGRHGGKETPDDEDCTYNSFHFWRVPLPELDLSLLDDGPGADSKTKEQSKISDSCSDAMES
uniref:Putative WW-binding domain-containing protein n=1 Tax=Oryzias latipes TaxID=8090 RepID=A0A3P9IBT0_ORYLA